MSRPKAHPNVGINNDHKFCSACGEHLSEERYIPALGQTYSCDCLTVAGDLIYLRWPDDLGPKALHWGKVTPLLLRQKVHREAFGSVDGDRPNELIGRRVEPAAAHDYLAVAEGRASIEECAELLDVPAKEIKKNVESVNGNLNTPVTWVNWEVDTDIAEIVGNCSQFDGRPEDVHHGSVSKYMELRSVYNFPSEKIQKICSEIYRVDWPDGGKQRETVWCIAGAFHLEKRRSYSDNMDYSYLRWGKAKRKIEEMTDEDYENVIEQKMK